MTVEEIVSAIIEAHGGKVRWEEAETLEAEISASGFLVNSNCKCTTRSFLHNLMGCPIV